MIKIVEVIGSLTHRGGAEVFFGSLCSQFATNQEIELSIICLHDNIDKSFAWIKNIPNVTFYCVDKQNGIDLLASKKFRETIKKIKPDIIHMHVSCFATYFLAFGFSKHHWRAVETIHTFPGFSLGKIEIKLKNHFIKKNKLIMVSISESLAKMAKNIYFFDKGLFIYNGFSPSLIKQESKKNYDFIIVASMTEVKNHKLLFDSFKLALGVNSELSLVCLGDGNLMNENQKYAERIGVKNNISFLGQIENPYEFLNQSKIIILSSKREGNPISILEGMSLGLPVIAPNVGGIPDIIINDENGLLFEVGNKEELCKAMLTLIKDEKLYNYISKNNMRKSQKYTIQYCADQYLSLFKDIVLAQNKKI